MEKTKEEIIFLTATGETITKLRLNAGYRTREAFAHEINMDDAQYARYEKGVNMEIISLHRLLTHFNLTLDNFYTQVYTNIKKQTKTISQTKLKIH